MYVTTSQESRRLDKVAIEEFGLPGLVLMENAARSILRAALEFLADTPKRSSRPIPSTLGEGFWPEPDKDF